MTLRDYTRRFEGPLMAIVLAGSLAGLTYILKDYFDGQERGSLYFGISEARRDERLIGDRRVEEVRRYYEALGTERDSRLAELSQQNKDLIELNRQTLQLVQAGRQDQQKSLAVARVAAAKATQASKLADSTNTTLNNVVSKQQIPETTVKKLNDKIKAVNHK